jgi:hypothetical protein
MIVVKGRVAIRQGSTVLFSDYENGGPMWADTGPRVARVAVSFPEPYLRPPAVMVGISMWDIDGQTNQRADIRAEEVTETGFDLVFRTWGDTRVARIRADWTALGEVRDDDDWDVR